MATFQKRGTSWRAIVRRKGQTETKTFNTKGEAQIWASAVEAALLNSQPVPDSLTTPGGDGATMSELFDKYIDLIAPKKKGERWETLRLKMLIRKFPVFQKVASTIDANDMAVWRDTRLKQVSASTVNREMCLVSTVFTIAIKEWRTGMTTNPCSLISKPKKPRARTQRVSQADRMKIIADLGWDGKSTPDDSKQWAAFAFIFAIETAMRKGEILSLTWDNVHIKERYAHLCDTKNGDSRNVPLSKRAIELFNIAGRSHRTGKVVPLNTGYLDQIIREARINTKLKHVRFHDARREAATTMAPKLSNVLELAAITGHKTLAMLQVYYNPTPADLASKLD